MHDPVAVSKAIECPLAAVSANLAFILDALNTRGILSSEVAIGVLATTAVETAHQFKPVSEAYWLSEAAREHYFDNTAYGKVDPETGQRYYGRGFVQRTWKAGYQESANKLHLDCVNHPDLLLQPVNAAADMALFFAEKPGLVDACNSRNWVKVRKLVNGGSNGLTSFLNCVQCLLKLIP